LAHIHHRKFATSPPNTIYVTTLPCKILNHNFTDVLHNYSTTINTLPLGKIFTFRSVTATAVAAG